MSAKYLCIHGHFYQPPRENPWTGAIERQPSAGDDHDWNVRIARECYGPNGRARAGERVVNNYARMSFNFGPTLLSWWESQRPQEYAKMLEADAESARRLGHGNALAQAYGHPILPLAAPRDRATQVRWGLQDFERRFGRKAEAMWLPECGADDATLRLLAGHGLKYAVLSPSQALRVRPDAKSAWLDVSDGSVEDRRPYRWWAGRPGSSPSLALFFYDGSLSQAVAFGGLMKDAEKAADEIARRFAPDLGEPELVTICTDGESYGHHEKFADLGLAWLLHEAGPRRGLEPVNFGWFLEKHPPKWQAEIVQNSSWSCAHGLTRWSGDCPCGVAEGGQARWRAPLREALDWLRGRLDAVYEKEAAALFADPWEARDDLFGWESRLKQGARAGDARRLLEMQRLSLYMFTSCAWFFSDVSGLEAAQNLKYAARAVELAGQAGRVDLEPELLRRLALAPSADPSVGDAAAVYRAGSAGKAASSSRM